MQFEGRILQGIWHAGATQAWPERAHDHTRIASVDRSNNETTDHYIVIDIDEPARTYIRQQRNSRLTQVIHFYQTYASAAADSAHDGGVLPRRQGPYDSGFEIVR